MSNSTIAALPCDASMPTFVVYIVLVVNILNMLISALGGLIPNFKALMDIFRHPDNQKRDGAKIQKVLEDVVQQVNKITPPSTPVNRSLV
jgi:hypothetical protein